MDYADEWCIVCGRNKGDCKHDKLKVTDDPEQAIRIRMIYAGIRPDNKDDSK